MKKYVLFTTAATVLLVSHSSNYASDLNEESKEGVRTQINSTNIKVMNDQTTPPSCRSPYVPRERQFTGYDRERDVVLGIEKSNEPFMQRLWNVIAPSKPKK